MSQTANEKNHKSTLVLVTSSMTDKELLGVVERIFARVFDGKKGLKEAVASQRAALYEEGIIFDKREILSDVQRVCRILSKKIEKVQKEATIAAKRSQAFYEKACAVYQKHKNRNAEASLRAKGGEQERQCREKNMEAKNLQKKQDQIKTLYQFCLDAAEKQTQTHGRQNQNRVVTSMRPKKMIV